MDCRAKSKRKKQRRLQIVGIQFVPALGDMRLRKVFDILLNPVLNHKPSESPQAEQEVETPLSGED